MFLQAVLILKTYDMKTKLGRQTMVTVGLTSSTQWGEAKIGK